MEQKRIRLASGKSGGEKLASRILFRRCQLVGFLLEATRPDPLRKLRQKEYEKVRLSSLAENQFDRLTTPTRPANFFTSATPGLSVSYPTLNGGIVRPLLDGKSLPQMLGQRNSLRVGAGNGFASQRLNRDQPRPD